MKYWNPHHLSYEIGARISTSLTKSYVPVPLEKVHNLKVTILCLYSIVQLLVISYLEINNTTPEYDWNNYVSTIQCVDRFMEALGQVSSAILKQEEWWAAAGLFRFNWIQPEPSCIDLHICAWDKDVPRIGLNTYRRTDNNNGHV